VPLTQEDLSSGDHIYVNRKGSLYSHHGIYAGKGRVVHYKGAVREKQDPTVIISTIDTFLNNGRLRLRSYKKRLPHSETLQIAKKHLDKKAYSLVFNNCEHFATYCVTGKKKSRQVRRIISGMATFTLAITGFFIQKKVRSKNDVPKASRKDT
jgi:hypothetical protein